MLPLLAQQYVVALSTAFVQNIVSLLCRCWYVLSYHVSLIISLEHAVLTTPVCHLIFEGRSLQCTCITISHSPVMEIVCCVSFYYYNWQYSFTFEWIKRGRFLKPLSQLESPVVLLSQATNSLLSITLLVYSADALLLFVFVATKQTYVCETIKLVISNI